MEAVKLRVSNFKLHQLTRSKPVSEILKTRCLSKISWICLLVSDGMDIWLIFSSTVLPCKTSINCPGLWLFLYSAKHLRKKRPAKAQLEPRNQSLLHTAKQRSLIGHGIRSMIHADWSVTIGWDIEPAAGLSCRKWPFFPLCIVGHVAYMPKSCHDSWHWPPYCSAGPQCLALSPSGTDSETSMTTTMTRTGTLVEATRQTMTMGLKSYRISNSQQSTTINNQQSTNCQPTALTNNQ